MVLNHIPTILAQTARLKFPQDFHHLKIQNIRTLRDAWTILLFSPRSWISGKNIVNVVYPCQRISGKIAVGKKGREKRPMERKAEEKIAEGKKGRRKKDRGKNNWGEKRPRQKNKRWKKMAGGINGRRKKAEGK